MRIEDFGPRMQKLIRWINKVETRLEKRARARGREGSGVLPSPQFADLPANTDPTKLDWGMGRGSLNPIVREHWNDQIGG